MAAQYAFVMKDMTKSFPGAQKPVLNHINLQFYHGAKIGIVGPNGAGKSTVLGLIPRLFDPIVGKVKLDGENVKHFTLESVREQIGIVLQQPILFGTTVRENIMYEKPDASDDEIVAAARAADVHDFIASLPDGYDTEIAEGGASLSGGQRQKIAIARAVIKNPPILILDEPTASLDARAEFEVFQRFKELSHGKTAVLISHRFSSVRMADRILVLAEGQLEAAGTHDELLAAGGRYAELFELQAAGYRD